VYDPQTTARFIAAHQKEDPTFFGEYHSVADVRLIVERLDEAWDPDTKDQTRDLTHEEVYFIENERTLCRYDFLYWASRYAWINDWQKKLTLFAPNVAQRVILDIWAEMEAKRWSIMMIQLKARQLGVSTLTELAVAHRVQFWPDVDAVVASSTPGKTEKMAKMIRTCWEHQPWWLMPKATAYFNLMPREFGGKHNSALDVSQSGNQFAGVSRGSTPSVFHGSELAEWTNPEEDVDASLLNAVHETPHVFFILESTALGRENWWHRKWQLSKEGWDRGRAKLCPIFLPWYVGRDIYPDETWLLKHPIPPDWSPDDHMVHYAVRAEHYVKAHPRIRQFLGEHWVMPKEQLWWYEVTREEYTRANELNRFLAEVCCDDFEAFQSTNYSAFRTEVILNLREKQREPEGVYKLVGIGEAREDIPPEYRPSFVEIDTSKPKIPIHAQWGQHDYRYELVPIRFEGYDGSSDGKIFIWDHPQDDFEYGCGVDTGDGIGLDGSIVEVLQKGDMQHNDKQMAEMASPYINAFSFWPWVYALGTYYSKNINGERRQARAVIDVQRNGESVQHELRKRGWANFHQWMRLDSKRLRLSESRKLGFVANAWSRPMMLDMLLSYINNQWCDIQSPMFVAEMESLERDDERQSMKAVFGGHDDRIMALGMILFSFHVLEARGPKMAIAEQRASLLASEDPVWDAGIQGRDMGTGMTVPTSMEESLRMMTDAYSRLGRR